MREGLQVVGRQRGIHQRRPRVWYQYELLNTKLTPTPGTQWRDPDKTVVKFEAPGTSTPPYSPTGNRSRFHVRHDPRRHRRRCTIAPLPVAPSHY